MNDFGNIDGDSEFRDNMTECSEEQYTESEAEVGDAAAAFRLRMNRCISQDWQDVMGDNDIPVAPYNEFWEYGARVGDDIPSAAGIPAGMYEEFNEYNDWDATSCANGDYNNFEDNEVFHDNEGE